MVRKTVFTMMIVLGVGSSAFAALTTLWTEDFSADPSSTWTQTGSGIYWNSGGQNLRISNYYDSTSTLSRPAGTTLAADSSFAFSLDYLPNYGWYSTEHNFGLVNDAGNGKVFVHAVPNWVGEWPNEVNLYGVVQDSEGNTYSTGYIRIGMYGPFVVDVNYDPATRTMTTSATLKSTGGVYGTGSVVLPADKTFSLDQFKFYNTSTTGGGDFGGYADNIVLKTPEPATLGLLMIGGLLAKRRRM